MKIDRVLLSAILFSAVWHIFWLSVLTVAVAPEDAKPLKFSSVSFLGPILEQSILSLSSARHERSVPEKRYLSETENLFALIKMEKALPDTYTEADPGAGIDIFESDETLTSLAISAVDGDKMEPGDFQ